MGARQVLVSLGWILSTLPATASAQPVGMDTCRGEGLRVCGAIEWTGTLVVCEGGDRYFSRYLGRNGWLMRAQGPIMVELETDADGPIRFPLVVEIVPVVDGPPFTPCTSPGYVVMHSYGINSPCSGAVERSAVIDVTDFVPVGALYALRIYSFGQPGRELETPALRCVRVIPQSQTASTRTWGHVKALFK